MATINQTIVTLAAATSKLLIASNSARKGLAWMNVGSNPMTVATASPAVVGSGFNYNPAAAAGQQGGADSWTSAVIPTSAFYAISSGGTTVVIWEFIG